MFSQETTTFVSAERQHASASTTHTTSTFVVRSHHPSLYKEPESDLCKRCMKFIYPLELMGPVMGNKYHKLCFRCHTCNRLLDFKTYKTNLNELNDKNVYCQTHNPKNGKYTETIFIYNNRARSKSPGVHEHSHESSLSNSSRQHSYRQAKSTDNLASINGEYENVRPLPPPYDGNEYERDDEYHNSSAFSQKKAYFSSSSKASNSTATQHHSNININQSGTLQKQLSENSNSESSGKLNEDKPSMSKSSKSNSNFSLDDYYASHGYLNANRVQNNAVIDIKDSASRVQYVPEKTVSHLNRQNSKKSADFYDDNGAEDEELAKYDHVVGNHETDELNYQFNSAHGYFDHQDRYHSHRNHSVNSNHSANGRDYSRSHSTDSSVCNNKTEIIIPVQTISLDNKSTTHSNIQSDRFESSNRKDSSAISNTNSVFIDSTLNQTSENQTSHANLVNIVGEMIARDKELRVYNVPTTPPVPSPRQDHPRPDSIRYPSVSPAPYSEPIVPTTGLSNTTITTSSVHQHHHHESSSSTSVKNVVVEVVESSGVSNNSFASSMTKQQQSNHEAMSNTFSSSNHPAGTATNSSLPPISSPPHVIIPTAPAVLPTPPPRFSGPNANIKQIFSEIVNHPSNGGSASGTNLPQQSIPPIYQSQTSNPNSFTGPNGNLKNIVSEMITHDALFVDGSLPPRDHMVPIQIINNSNINSKPTHEELVKRLGEIVGEDKGYGLAKVTSHYDELRSRLSITVHEARHLRNTEKKGVIDPYARVYLVPDDKPSYKRKTRLIKDNVNPVWQETFDYPMPMARALTKTLIVNLKDERGLFERQENVFLGEVVINLKDVPNLTSPHTKWYYLQPTKMTK